MASTADPTRAQDAERRWYLVRALTGRELVAEQHLRRQGFETFLPKQRKTVRHARKITISLGAYFPGYLFVRLDLGRDRWRSVNGTLGVAHLVGPGERPVPAPEGVVEALIAAADGRQIMAGPSFAAGDAVRIIGGAFADQLAVIDRLDDGGRVRVLLDIVAGQTPVRLDRDLLAKAS